MLPIATTAGCSRSEEASDGAGGALSGSGVLEAVGGGRVRIARSALDQRWMLRTALTPRNDSEGFKGREFEDYQKILPLVGRVAMLRDEGNRKWSLYDVTADGDDGDVFATFEAVESEDSIVLDLDAAFGKVTGDISVFDAVAPFNLPKAPFKSSSIVGALTQEDDTVFLRKIVEIDLPKVPAADRYRHSRVDYAFGLYREADEFIPRVNNTVGSFYVNPPVVRSAKPPRSFVHRHDEGRPIVYAIPASMPKERVDDIQKSAAYWNVIFARAGVAARIKIDTLADGVDALRTDKNTIEFVTVPVAGARGINQTDAWTGRILKSNVHVAAVFADAATDIFNTRWARIQAEAGSTITAPDQKLVTRAVSDYYINTFTHEIGHTLGLRHNFAGNLATPIDGPTWVKALDTYVRGGDVGETAVLSTSVMEYLPTAYAMLLGAHIRRGDAPFTYDVAVVRAIYGGKAVSATELGLFCEKEQEGTHVDCLQNDTGPNVFSDFTVNEQISDAAIGLALRAKKEPLIEMVQIDPAVDPRERYGLVLGKAVEAFLAAFRRDAKLVAAGDPAARQRTAFAALTGEVGMLAKHVIETKTLSEADIKAFSGKLRQKLVVDLAAAGVVAAPGAVDAYVVAFERSFTATVREFLASSPAFVAVP
jgi:hypothetical protein